ncbi:hypothetical protein EVAR_19770_1 [Eumeta japonica]|uniref:Uncharacterized protein n=1 Tax=Eumeta variegata TaxID=151549 RepID=A0A4C1UQK9_EUMVA|nr:hypothetical protein EVAR_19770_1 [Eumeta japonica]
MVWCRIPYDMWQSHAMVNLAAIRKYAGSVGYHTLLNTEKQQLPLFYMVHGVGYQTICKLHNFKVVDGDTKHCTSTVVVLEWKLHSGREIELEVETEIGIENWAKVKIECTIGIRVKSVTGIGMKEMDIERRTRIGVKIGIELWVLDGAIYEMKEYIYMCVWRTIELEVETGIEIENGAKAEIERAIKMRTISVTGIGMRISTGTKIQSGIAIGIDDKQINIEKRTGIKNGIAIGIWNS